jgi:hypothetical protein
MVTQEDTPPHISALLEALEPTPRQITLHVAVKSVAGERSYWMTEGGTIFFTTLSGELRRATEVEASRILKGLDLARRSPSFEVVGRVAEAHDLDIARGLVTA